MSNILLTGPAGSTFVEYSVNFDVTGSFLLTSVDNATARGIVEVDDAAGELGSMLASTNASEDGAGGVFQGQSPSANSSFDVAAATETEIGQNGAPVTVMLNLATNANVMANDGSGSATVNFFDPLSFPTDGPVFNFFDLSGNPISGWTANSDDGCIVNNAFVCGSITAPGSVPELSTWAMMLAGFAGLGFASYWRSKKGGVGTPVGLSFGPTEPSGGRERRSWADTRHRPSLAETTASAQEAVVRVFGLRPTAVTSIVRARLWPMRSRATSE
jgi:hypothetical protein